MSGPSPRRGVPCNSSRFRLKERLGQGVTVASAGSAHAAADAVPTADLRNNRRRVLRAPAGVKGNAINAVATGGDGHPSMHTSVPGEKRVGPRPFR